MFIFITRYQHEALTEHETHQGNIIAIISFSSFCSYLLCFVICGTYCSNIMMTWSHLFGIYNSNLFLQPEAVFWIWRNLKFHLLRISIFYGPKLYLILMEPEVPSSKIFNFSGLKPYLMELKFHIVKIWPEAMFDGTRSSIC